MAFKQQPSRYYRRTPPVQAESIPKYQTEELKKIEEAILSLYNAVIEIEARITAAGIP